jgi:DinB superfamily
MARTCEQCGFDWEAGLDEDIRLVARFPDRASELLEGAGDVAHRRPTAETWSPNEYVWHLVDIFRMFSEWLHMTRVLDVPTLAPFDSDQLATVRGYAERPVQTGLWALRNAVELFVQEAARADPARTVTYKGWRDVTAREVIGFAAHEVAHHTHDLERQVAG